METTISPKEGQPYPSTPKGEIWKYLRDAKASRVAFPPRAKAAGFPSSREVFMIIDREHLNVPDSLIWKSTLQNQGLVLRADLM